MKLSSHSLFLSLYLCKKFSLVFRFLPKSNAANHLKFETEMDPTYNYILDIKYNL